MKNLKYRIAHLNVDFANVFDFLNELLMENGIDEKDIQSFLRPSKKFVNDPFLLKNMDKAVKIVHDHVEKGDRILVRVDCDVDGVSSSGELIQFLWKIKPGLQVDFIQNYDKHHGLTYTDVCNVEKDYYGLIIIPDASMTLNDAKVITKNYTADIVVLDHHIIEEENGDCYTNYCTAVNCTDGQYPNPCLCGTGVVQKFIEAYVDTYGLDPALKEEWLDLVSTATIADSMSLKNLENRYYVIEGLKEERQKNELLDEIYKRTVNEEEEWKGRHIQTIGWKIAPLINSCIRSGSAEEQQEMFRAYCGIQEDVIYHPRRRRKDDPQPEPEVHTLQWNVARELVNTKSRQDAEARRYMKQFSKTIDEEGLDKNSIIFVDASQVLTNSNVSGLVANKLAAAYMRPAVVLRQKNATEYGGSMRGFSGVIENTKEFLESTGLVKIFGHDNAGGVNIVKDTLPQVIKKCNEMCDPSLVGIVYDCDYEIPARSLKAEYVREVGENYMVFGNDIPEPLFLISDLEINASEIMAYGENQNFIRFTYKNIPFVKKYCKSGEWEEMTCRELTDIGTNNKKLKLNIIGKFSLSLYEGKVYPQIIIVDYDSEVIDDGKPVDDDDWDTVPFVEDKKNTEDFDW